MGEKVGVGKALFQEYDLDVLIFSCNLFIIN